MQYANRPVMTVNLFLLMAIGFLPFPTRLVAEAIRSSTARWLLVIALLLSGLWSVAASERSLLRPT